MAVCGGRDSYPRPCGLRVTFVACACLHHSTFHTAFREDGKKMRRNYVDEIVDLYHQVCAHLLVFCVASLLYNN